MSNNPFPDKEIAPLCLINLFYKLKSKLKNEKFEEESDKEQLNINYTASSKEITDQISKLFDILFLNFKPEIQQSNLENSSSQASNGELITEYESMIQKLEAEVRNHIRVEQQLKLHLDSFQTKIEENEKREENNIKTIQMLNDKIKQLQNDNKNIQTENSQLKEKNIELVKGILRNSLSNIRKSDKKLIIEGKDKQKKIVKIEKEEIKIDGNYNKSELFNKTQQIDSKKFIISKCKEKNHSIKNLFRNTTESFSKLNDVKALAPENSIWLLQSQSNMKNKNLADQKSAPIPLLTQRKRNSENISREIKETRKKTTNKKSPNINSGSFIKRIINEKAKPYVIYKSLNSIEEPHMIKTERQTKKTMKDSVDNTYSKFKNCDKLKISKVKKTDKKENNNNFPDSNLLINISNKDKNRGEDDNLIQNDEVNESIGREANVCEKNIDNVNRRARSISYQYGATFNKFDKTNTNDFQLK